MNNKTLQMINDPARSRGEILLVLYLQNIAKGAILEKGQLCQDLGMSERNLRRLMQKLEEEKMIKSWIDKQTRKRVYELRKESHG